MMAGGPVLDEEERRGYSLVCGFSIQATTFSEFSFFAASFVRLLEASEPSPPPVCSFVI
jgi:hypothetical protein